MNLNIGIIKSRKLAFLLTFLITLNTIPDFDVSLRFLANEIFQVFFFIYFDFLSFQDYTYSNKENENCHFVETIEKQNLSVYNFSLSGAFY